MAGAVDNAEALEALRASHPDMFVLHGAVPHAELTKYLRGKGWCGEGVEVSAVALAGEVFNMNCTVRVGLSDGSCVILKQSRPYVERYPSIKAPIERLDVEARFYSLVAGAGDAALAAAVPKVHGVDLASHILAMEDVGREDWGCLYDPSSCSEFPEGAAALLGAWLAKLHCIPHAVETKRTDLPNVGMRNLTSLYVFELPLTDNGGGVDLDGVTPGLEAAARAVREDDELCDAIVALGKRHLYDAKKVKVGADGVAQAYDITADEADGLALCHGDFFPAAWMKRSGAGTGSDVVVVIDVEFAHFGRPEFDLGNALAHLLITAQARAASALYTAYAAARPAVDRRLAVQLAGVEIVRRLIGVAQLPLKGVFASLQHKKALLDTARRFVLEPDTCMI
eukprot:TRINITY_DN3776_c0_g1_i1.p1 TRINITY_DN3776_c0_g1~~TRINITY_DN3776_c0_g1_i1.p1  ORF type:complete len:396 (+),score=113.88 TRINITY_DN3776_c0_g1_i1:73-1260(+)